MRLTDYELIERLHLDPSKRIYSIPPLVDIKNTRQEPVWVEKVEHKFYVRFILRYDGCEDNYLLITRVMDQQSFELFNKDEKIKVN
jgi:hypothetical protein